LRVYNLSKTARDELIESLGKITSGHPIKSHDLKIAESDDPNYSIVFDEEEKLYLGKKKDPPAYFPLLKDEYLITDRPVITVDSGAIKFVCNGANIIAVGRVTLSKPEMESATKGAVITNLHYVGDKFWDMLKELKP